MLPWGRGTEQLSGQPHSPTAGTAPSPTLLLLLAHTALFPVSALPPASGSQTSLSPSSKQSLCPPSAQMAALPSMVGEEHLLGSSQTAPPHKTFIFFSTTLTKQNFCRFSHIVADLPALSMPTHAGPCRCGTAQTRTLLGPSLVTRAAAAAAGLHSQL